MPEPAAQRQRPLLTPGSERPVSGALAAQRVAARDPDAMPPISTAAIAAVPVEPIGNGRIWAGAWAGTGLFVTGGCAACWHWQDTLMRVWPPLARVFAGLHGVV